MVQGHIEATASILTIEEDGIGRTVEMVLPESLRPYLVSKGFIAINGVSLTVAGVGDKTFDFALIPHTATVTTLGIKGPGAPVNLEVDLVAKYVERLMRA